MPYRRLPNTDAARVAALEKAVGMELRQSAGKQPASFKVLNEARVLLPRLKAAITQFRYNYEQLGKSNKQCQPLVKSARMYISHFIQVLNMSVSRQEIKAEHKRLYELDPDDFAVPDLMSEEAVLLWGKRIIEGENRRMALRGGTPIYNPTIAKVKVHYDIFAESYEKQRSLQTATARSQAAVASMRREADALILDLWNQVEAFYAALPPAARLARCRDYGIVYYYRSGEKRPEND